MLLFDGGSFFQILEGEPEVVARLYIRLAADKRHSAIKKVIAEPIEARSFANWTMGYAKASREDLRRIPGLNDFFVGGTCYADLDKGRAKILLAAFREGGWRSQLV